MNDPARFKVIIRGRRGGKTEEELQGAVRDAVRDPGLHWVTGPYYKQIKAIAWTRLEVILKADPDWRLNEQELYAENQNIIAKDGRATRIELKGCDKEDSLVGVGLKSVRMDEAALTKHTVWTNIIRPMLADYQAPAWFYSTPRGRNWLYDLYLRGQGNDKDWKSWKQPTRINKYIHPNEIADARKDMSERLFRQEFDAEFLDDETGVFKRVRQCIVGEYLAPTTGRYYVMGVDLAKTQDFTVLSVVDSVTRQLVAWERFQDINWTEQKIRIQKLAARYNNALCIIDSTGVGDPIVEDLQNAGLSLYYEKDKPGFKFTHETKTQLIENLAITIEQRRVTFPLEPVLIDELMNFEYFITDAGRIKYSAPEGKHDDCVISLGLAVWALRSQLHEAALVIKANEENPDRQGRGERSYEELAMSGGYGT